MEAFLNPSSARALVEAAIINPTSSYSTALVPYVQVLGSTLLAGFGLNTSTGLAAAGAALAVPALAKLGQGVYKVLKSRFKRSDKKEDIISVDFDPVEIAGILQNGTVNDSDTPENRWAKYIIANELLSLKSKDSEIEEKATLVRNALRQFPSDIDDLKATDFDADKAVDYWKANGGSSEKVLEALFSGDANAIYLTQIDIGPKTFEWMLVLLSNKIFEQVISGTVQPQSNAELNQVVDLLKRKLNSGGKTESANMTVTLQDAQGGRVDFSANPKAVFAPPRDASDADLGTIDLGVLGDAYICGLSSTNKRRWVLLPSCLQRFAYEQLFKDSVARFHAKAKERSKLNIARVLLF
jgi:hypothetical protein